MTTITPNLQTVANNWKTGVVIVGGAITAFLVAPIIYTIIGGMIGIAIAATIAIMIIPFLVVLGNYIADQKIKWLKWVAAQSPVEAMQNVYLQMEAKLKEFKHKVEGLGAGLKTYRDNLAEMKKKWPKDDYTDRDAQLEKFQQIYDLRLEQIREKQKELNDYADDIEKTEAEWNIGLCASNVQEAAGMTEQDFNQRMITKAAKAAVTDQINSSFAAMDIALLDDKIPTLMFHPTKVKHALTN